MPHFTWASGTDIAQWANRLDARAILPQVVRRLIHGTCKQVLRIGLPAGEGIQLGGYDGVVQVVDGNAFVPRGQSVWEMGVDKGVKKKADKDYVKRTNAPGDVDPKVSVYVFVTPRRWGGKEAWRRTRNKEEQWAEVRAYDADDLEQWLELAPATHAWLTRLIQPWTEGVQDLEAAWTEWASRTNPALTQDLVLSGRQELVNKLQDWLRGPPSALTIRADSAFEALLAATAAILSMDVPDRAAVLARTALISDPAAWRQLVGSVEPLLLIADPEMGVVPGLAPERGHHVLVPIGPNSLGGPNKLELRRTSSIDVVAALGRMGLPHDTAQHLAREAKGRLSILLRLLGPTGAAASPSWALPAEGLRLKPILLAGGWDAGSEEDRKIIEQLAHRSHREVLDTAVRWLEESDSPLARTGNDWRWVSREDGWSLLRRYLTAQDLDAFGTVFLQVLGSADPRFDLPADERWLASVHGKHPVYSQVLSQGLAETAALLGSRDEGIQDATRGADRVAVLVRKLLAERPDWRVWCSLSDLLPDLAEAAPDAFLDAVESIVLGNDDVFQSLFQEEKTAIFGGSSHTGLLWALERLAWSADLLSRTVQILGQLAARDPGGHLANRPLNSLREILLSWHPQTNADLKQRLQAIDALASTTPDVAWTLCLKLLPQCSGDHSSPTPRPHWRKWNDGWTGKVSNVDYWQAAEAVSDRLLSWVGDDCTRWIKLIEAIGNVPERRREEVVRRIQEVPGLGWSPSERSRVWQALRGILHRHRQFSDADWSLPDDLVERIDAVYRALEPEDLTDRYSWLFSFNPELPNLTSWDYDVEEAALGAARREAVLTTLQQGGLDSVLHLAGHIDNPGALGFLLVSIGLEESLATQLLTGILTSSDRRLVILGRGYVSGRFRSDGWPWIESLFREGPGTRWSGPERAQFACGLPFDPITWKLVSSWGNDANRAYWAMVEGLYLEHPDRDGQEALRALLAAGRPYAALDLASMSIRRGGTSPAIPAGLLVELLEVAAMSDPQKECPPQAVNEVAHHVQRVLKAIDRSADRNEAAVARLEWQWLPALCHGHRGPNTLQRALSRDADLFAKIVALVYRSENDDDKFASEDDVVRAQRGCELLREWEQVPGLRDDGSIDDDFFNEWIDTARAACAESRHLEIGDQQIGQVLAYSPDGVDGAWPHEAVRGVVERLGSQSLEEGLFIGILNKRGMVGKSPYEGGKQERELAERFRCLGAALAGRWPRIAKILREVSENYESDARWEDIQAEEREFF